MNIAIIGSGNVGGALAQRFLQAGHTVWIGARFPLSEKAVNLAFVLGQDRFVPPAAAARQADVIVLATPAVKAIEVTRELGDTTGKIIIDTMNVVGGSGPAGFSNTTDAILAHTQTREVVKCFNTTGFENLLDPQYGGQAADMFMAGESESAKAVAAQLATQIGFEQCYDLGGSQAFVLIEQLALGWITLALFQGHGRDMAFKILKR